MPSTRVRSLALALAFLPLAVSAAPPPATAPRPNLILIVLDTLRYDVTSLGDSAGNSTPFLASLQARGVTFTHAYSTHDFTPPSHFSVLTGLKDGLGGGNDHAQNRMPFQLGQTGDSPCGRIANGLWTRQITGVRRPKARLTQS